MKYMRLMTELLLILSLVKRLPKAAINTFEHYNYTKLGKFFYNIEKSQSKYHRSDQVLQWALPEPDIKE